MLPIIAKDGANIEARWGTLHARLDGSAVRFAHAGLMLLGKIKKKVRENAPDHAAAWEEAFGPAWKDDKEAKPKLAASLADTMKQAGVGGLVLWDTMRNGSDYWRPGNLLTEAVDLVRQFDPSAAISYAREDGLCPPASLLDRFAKDGAMTFGEYAEQYAQYLRSEGRLAIAAAAVLTALAVDRLAVFYCVDPYIPGYGDPSQAVSDLSYTARSWMPGLRDEGCHRVVLASELARYFLGLGLHVQLLEVNPAFRRCQVRHFP
jgi:hypothetical protein